MLYNTITRKAKIRFIFSVVMLSVSLNCIYVGLAFTTFIVTAQFAQAIRNLRVLLVHLHAWRTLKAQIRMHVAGSLVNLFYHLEHVLHLQVGLRAAAHRKLPSLTIHSLLISRPSTSGRGHV